MDLPMKWTLLTLALALPTTEDVLAPYYPPTTFQTARLQSNLRVAGDINTMAVTELAKTLQVPTNEIQLKNSFTGTDGTTHFYAVRLLNGIPVENQNAAVHIRNGQVVARSGVVIDKTAARLVTTPSVSPQSAIDIAETKFAMKKLTEPQLIYLQTATGIVLAYQFQVRQLEPIKWYEVSVDARSGKVVQAVDYVREFSFGVEYDALPIPKQNPEDGFELVKPQIDLIASPLGWHDDGTIQYNETIGNNVFSHIDNVTAKIKDGQYRFNWDANAEPEESEDNRNAAIINNFYISNVIHDIMYKYGFTEAAGNFQQDNFKRGGLGNDRVNLTNQWPNRRNNAFMATPPDGQSPIMGMFLWNRTAGIKRDSSLDNTVVIHEYGHGISNRLTGGNRQGQCLFLTESGGLGEGWSDTLAAYLAQKESSKNTDSVAIGAYMIRNATGIRAFPYNRDMAINPLTYTSLFNNTFVHRIGTTWATMLYDMYWNIVDVHGFNPNWYDSKSTAGNIVAMQLVIGGMTFQPCNPTLLQARDAILVADQTYYGGKHSCLVWKAFARRGAGTDAVQEGFVDGFSVPEECQ
jgi:extracellular elastinolytic metalloproteinase